MPKKSTPKDEPKELKIVSKIEKKEPLKYPPKEERAISFILLFTVLGHPTWRLQPYKEKADLDKLLARPDQTHHAKILDKKWFVFNRLTGEITPE